VARVFDADRESRGDAAADGTAVALFEPQSLRAPEVLYAAPSPPAVAFMAFSDVLDTNSNSSKEGKLRMSRKTTAFIVAFTITVSGAAYAAERITPPAVPSIITAHAGFKPFLVGHAIGTQNFICAPAATESGFDWLFIGPQATLFNADLEQIATHYQSKNPLLGDAIQATWQNSRDTSGVWATKMFGSSDPDYVAADAIEWLLLRVTGPQVGPTGGDKLASAKFIQRVNTVGGVKPPSSDCTASTINTRMLVYYEADYYFYE
jgi:hypothetical protein